MEVTAKNELYNPIVQATAALLRRCDGARTVDGAGFNKFDAGFVRDMFYKGYPLTDRQVNALRKTLLKYKGQLLSMGINYDDLPKVVLQEQLKINIPKFAYSIKINFGKHNGKSLGQIAEQDVSYVQWLAKDSVFPDIKTAAQAVLEGKEISSKSKPKLNIPKFAYKFMINFGKFNGQSLGQIAEQDSTYIEWLAKESYLPEVKSAAQAVLQGRELDTSPIITIDGSVCIITNVNQSIKDELDKLTCYWFQGAEYTEKYKSGEWDGYIHLCKPFKGEFPIGYLRLAIALLKKNNIEPKIIDNRRQPEQHEDFYSLQFKGNELRAYQLKAVTEAVLATQGTIVLPTGTGKTEVAISIIFTTKASTVIVVHRKELLYQWQKRLQKAFPGITIGIVGDGHKEESIITVVMIQSMATYRLTQKYDCLIVDEGHHTPADTYYDFCMKVDAYFRYTLTATPQREKGDESKIWAMTGYPIKTLTAEEAMDEGYLAQSEFIYLPMPSRYIGAKNWQSELAFACEDFDNNQMLVEAINGERNMGELIYVDVRIVEHGKTLAKMLNDYGVRAKFIYGNDTTNKRQEVLDEFRTGSIVMISTLIKEGVDLPEMSCIFLAGPANGVAENLQKVGRVLRPKAGQKAKIYDRYDNSYYLRDWFNTRQSAFAKQYGKYFTPYSKAK